MRPFESLIELETTLNVRVGDILHLKSGNFLIDSLYLGNAQDTETEEFNIFIVSVPHPLTAQDLFDNFEYFSGSEWKKFGI